MPPLIPLTEIPTLSLLYKLSHLVPPTGPATPKPSAKYNSLISLIRTDITFLQVSAIVNAANTSLLGGGGVDGAIHAKAGPELFEECRILDGCETGSAKITNAYELPCDKVIHAVGPVYWSVQNEQPGLEKKLLRSCYRKSLDLAAGNGCKSIAFAALSTGVYGYPSKEAAKEAIGEVKDWLNEKGDGAGGIDRIVFCCFERKDELAYEEWLPQYFPPTDSDVPGKKQQGKEALLKDMPDPPATEPAEHGQPPAKVQKVTGAVAEDSPSNNDDWETVEMPEFSDVNGYADIVDDRRSTSVDEDAMTQEEKEKHGAALYVAQLGGDPPQNALEKDW